MRAFAQHSERKGRRWGVAAGLVGLAATGAVLAVDDPCAAADARADRAQEALVARRAADAIRQAEAAGEAALAAGCAGVHRRTLLQRGQAHMMLREHERAAELATAAWRQAEAAGAVLQAADARGLVALAAQRAGRDDEAVALYRATLDAYAAAAGAPGVDADEARRMRANALVYRNRIARIRRDQGRLALARAEYEAVIAEASAAGLVEPARSALNGLGNLLFRHGAIGDAATAYRRSLALAREHGRRFGEAVALAGLGAIQLTTGEPELAARSYREAAEAYAELGQDARRAPVLRSLALADWMRGDLASAERVLRDTLAAADASDDAELRASCLADLGELARRRGELDRAAELAAAATAALPADAPPLVRAYVALVRGDVALDRGEAHAPDAFAACAAAAALSGTPWLEAAAAAGRARWLERRGESAAAARAWDAALAAADRTLGGAGASAEQVLAFEALPAIYTGAAAAALDREDAGETQRVAAALAILERLRAFHLEAAWLRPGQAEGAAAGTASYLEELTGLQRALAAAAEASDRERLRERIAAVEAELDAAEKAALRPVAPRGAALGDRWWEALPAATRVVVYLLREAGSWALVAERAGLRAVPLALGDGFAERTAVYRDLVAAANGAGRAPLAAGYRLYRELVEPVLTLPGGEGAALVVLADGPLYALPIEALPMDPRGERFVGTELVTSYAPSLAWLLELAPPAAPSGPTRVLAVADPRGPWIDADGTGDPAAATWPPLRHARAEVAALAARLANPVETLVGAAATESAVRARIGTADVVHLATHGRADFGYGGRATLVLGVDPDGPSAREDGLLQAREIARLRVPARLVVLSACDGGAGRVVAGEGVLSLARSFHVAGAPAVVLSLWPVDDRSTARLMEHLYAGLAEGLGVAEALARARAELRASGYDHPRAWAAFVASGAAGVGLELEERSPRWPWMMAAVALVALAVGGRVWARREPR